MTNEIINNLAARFALASAINTANANAADTIANRFDRFSDDDLDYLPASLRIASACAEYIEAILIPVDENDTQCIDAIAELNNDDDFRIDCETSDASYLSLFIRNSADYGDETPADALQNSMMRDAYNNAFASLTLPLDTDIRKLPADFETNLDATLTNISNAFTLAHRAAYPQSYSNFKLNPLTNEFERMPFSDDDYPTTITLDPNPYL